VRRRILPDDHGRHLRHGNALDCGDIVNDGAIDALDVDALRIKVTGGDPLYDICNGPWARHRLPGRHRHARLAVRRPSPPARRGRRPAGSSSAVW
jgi:hypothetical protein